MKKIIIISLIIILFFSLCAGCLEFCEYLDETGKRALEEERIRAIQSKQELLRHIDKLNRIRSWDELTPSEQYKIQQIRKRIDELDKQSPKNLKRIYELYDEIDDIRSGDYKKINE